MFRRSKKILRLFLHKIAVKQIPFTLAAARPRYWREQIVDIIKTVEKHGKSAISEVTIECNPSDVSAEFLETVFAAGANRLSFGLQSAVDSERRALGRRADRVQVEKAVQTAKNIGFSNISLDLMIGIPGQTAESLRESIRFCAASGVQHISAYILKIEPGTVFAKRAPLLDLPDDDKVADFYLQAVDELQNAGFRQYEISNFAVPGFESRHNLKYWRLEDYLGVGAAAHSCVNGKRFFYPRDIEYFIGAGAPVADGESGSREEKIMLGLRLAEGIPLSLLSEAASEKLPFLQNQGYARVNAEKIALTPKGFLLSNTIINLLSEG